jgi:flagellar P-ring protein precursor FlgI
MSLVPLFLSLLAPLPQETLPSNGSVRIGDLSDVRGLRPNALYGMGLVIGLDGTGDNARATRRALANFLEQNWIEVDPQDLVDGSVALVAVTATLGPFDREGKRIDVSVSSLAGASSLFGGTLLFTPLHGPDGTVYAVAQGPVAVGGHLAQGAAASVSRNHPTSGIVPLGATIEQEIDVRFVEEDGSFHLLLREPSFELARRVQERINRDEPGLAIATDAGSVRVVVPELLRRNGIVEFVARLADLRVTPAPIARVVVNERTGTIVAGESVRISKVAIAHGNLTVTVAESPEVSQPAPLSGGQTVTVPRTELTTEEEGRSLTVVEGGATIGDLAAALNALGATPRDLITIFEALRRAGALHADLEVL